MTTNENLKDNAKDNTSDNGNDSWCGDTWTNPETGAFAFCPKCGSLNLIEDKVSYTLRCGNCGTYVE